MAWQMPTSGQWNSGMAMAPDMSNMNMANMGSYTPEQWAAMQHQNWQQWAQWQQQYAQWQSQYGEKYTEQMQAIQAMGGMPPLPPANTAPPPAPPPPEQPPPPPHENNQPLYGHSPANPAPVPAPSNKHQNTNSTKNANVKPHSQTGNNSNWSYSEAAQPIQSTPSTQGTQNANAEALKKLAEEERLFDIQFQKWEEEIEKWKRDNVNHPDKQAYSEYEQKFESCRVQLMERRQQMKQKRARLMSNAPPPPPQTAKPAVLGNVSTTAIPPNLKNTNKNNYSQQSQNYSDHGNSQYQQQQYNVSKPTFNRNNTKNIDPQDRYGSYQDMSDNNYPPPDNFSAPPPSNPSFLPTSGSNKGIPGLDLVPEAEKLYGGNEKQDIIDISDEPPQTQPPLLQLNAPDYTTISKGINNILGDEKIMNILSMVRGQTSQDPNITSNISAPAAQYNVNNQNNAPYGQENINQNNIPYGQDNRNQNNTPYGQQNRNPNSAPYGQQQNRIQHNAPFGQENRNQNNAPYGQDNRNQNNALYGQDNRNQNNAPYGQENRNQNNVPYGQENRNQNNAPYGQENRNQNNAPYGQENRNQNNAPYGQENRNQNYNQQYDNRQNMPYNRQGPNYPVQPNQEVNPKYPPQNRMPDNMSQEQFNYNRNAQYGGNDGGPPPYDNGPGPMTVPPPSRNNMQHAQRPPIRPLMQEIAPHPNVNDFPGAPNERKPLIENNMNPIPKPPVRPQWIDEPMFTPSLIVEYEHKPLRLKARDFIEPVHMFDYNHVSKDGEVKKKDFEREVDELFSRKPRRSEKDVEYSADRYARDHYSRDFERRVPRPREDLREEFRPRVPPKDEYDDRRRPEPRYDERRRDDRDKYSRREDDRGIIGGNRDRDRDLHRDRGERERSRDIRREEIRYRSRSRERDSRKRGLSRDSEISNHSMTKKSREKDDVSTNSASGQAKHIVMIDDLLESPGRSMRPEKIVIILRGPPGSGKSYLAKLIRDREAEYGGTVRIMSIDDYFMQEGEVEEEDPTTGKLIKKPTLKYEYDEALEETYMNSLKRAFKRSLTDGYFTFLIYDAVNEQLKGYADIWNFARQNGFQVYICTMELDPQVCYKRNIHNRQLDEIEVIAARFFPTPAHHIQLDATTLLQNAAITDVHMEDADDEVIMEDAQAPEVESVFTSKWEKMDDVAQLARLDGTSKPLRPSQFSMEDYLQLDDWTPNKAKPGKKSVRWADIEERRQQEKMRAIGFVVGQTDWNRMTDPTMGSSALTQTKYIERVRRN